MTPYFSRLAQRGGGSTPGGRGADRAGAVDATTMAMATPDIDAGDREQERTVEAAPTPTTKDKTVYSRRVPRRGRYSA